MTFQFDADIDPRLVTTLILAEGDEPYVYKDSLGYSTIGIGRCVDRTVAGTGLSPDERKYLLQNDIRSRVSELKFRYPWALALDAPRWRAMVEALFVLGFTELTKFPKFLAAMSDKNYTTASNELLNSAWHQEAPSRVERLAATILTGKD